MTRTARTPVHGGLGTGGAGGAARGGRARIRGGPYGEGVGDVTPLYTDGLIERRGEDIDAGLGRLIDVLGACGHLGTGQLADTVLARLGVPGGGRDDIALIVTRP
ncbi:SpoIIE family protein phosphatase [Streptomyces sp. NPDC046870]|uniref:SpoIIE family protein phosphatase n=1 Tax=Streptomyces sp. NPDC046870 TaxID=3155135 RepID=UPI0034535353